MQLRYGPLGKKLKAERKDEYRKHGDIQGKIRADVQGTALEADSRITGICNRIARGQFHIAAYLCEILLNESKIPNALQDQFYEHLTMLTGLSDEKKLREYRKRKRYSSQEKQKHKSDKAQIQRAVGNKKPHFFDRSTVDFVKPIDKVAGQVTGLRKQDKK